MFILISRSGTKIKNQFFPINNNSGINKKENKKDGFFNKKDLDLEFPKNDNNLIDADNIYNPNKNNLIHDEINKKIEINNKNFNEAEPITLNINKGNNKIEDIIEEKAAPPPKTGENRKDSDEGDTIVFGKIDLSKKINNDLIKVESIMANRPKKKRRNIKNIPRNTGVESLMSYLDKSKGADRSMKDLKSKDQTTCRKLLQDKEKNKNINNELIPDIFKNFDLTKKEVNVERHQLNELIIGREHTDSDLNDLPYTKALRLDDRNFLTVFFIVFFNKVDVIKIIFFRDDFEFLPISVNIFILDELLDLFFNALFYNYDIISQKYHSNGKLDFFTEQLLSFASNFVSYLILRFFSKLLVYDEYFSLIEKEVRGKEKLAKAVDLGIRVMKKAMIIFSVIDISILLVILYYLSIFCALYSKSQKSFFKNYGIGEIQTLMLNFVIAILVATFRKLALKYRNQRLYETSKFIDNFL